MLIRHPHEEGQPHSVFPFAFCSNRLGGLQEGVEEASFMRVLFGDERECSEGTEAAFECSDAPLAQCS